MKKVCTNKDCFHKGMLQDISNFSFRNKKDQIYESWCKDCKSSYKKKWRQDNKDSLFLNDKVYREKNAEKIDAWRKDNHALISEVNKNYYKNNQISIKKKQENYRSENKPKLSIYNKIYRKNRRKIDPTFKLRNNVSRAISRALIKQLSAKNNDSCLEFLSFPIQELQWYLESLFEPWMNWNNYGAYDIETWNDADPSTWTWNIDHIIPQSTLPYTSMQDDNFKRCWALKNLRPYSAKQNLLDGARNFEVGCD